MRKKAQISDQENNTATAKMNQLLSALTLVLTAAVFLFRSIAVTMLVSVGNGKFYPTGNYFVFDNLMHTSFILLALFLLILISRQNYIYLPYIGKQRQASLDERQVDVRRRVIEKSYRFIFLGFVFTTWSGIYADFTAKPIPASPGDLQFLVMTIILIIFGLPSLLAAFDKKA